MQSDPGAAPMRYARCSQRRKDGEPCRGRPVTGGTRCPAHGGRRPDNPAIDPEAAAARLLAATRAIPKDGSSAFLTAAAAWK